MIQKAMEFVESASEMTLKLELIDTIRTVTEGKVRGLRIIGTFVSFNGVPVGL